MKLLHLVQPLTKLTPEKINFKWTEIKQKSFDKIKQIAAYNTLLAYLYFIKLFYIHTDTINFQLLSVVIHKVKLITFYSRKIVVPQTYYMVT